MAATPGQEATNEGSDDKKFLDAVKCEGDLRTYVDVETPSTTQLSTRSLCRRTAGHLMLSPTLATVCTLLLRSRRIQDLIFFRFLLLSRVVWMGVTSRATEVSSQGHFMLNRKVLERATTSSRCSSATVLMNKMSTPWRDNRDSGSSKPFPASSKQSNYHWMANPGADQCGMSGELKEPF